MIIEREHFAAASRSPVIASVSARSSFRRPIKSFVPLSITPGGANRITGKCRSIIATGPCRKSADDDTVLHEDIALDEFDDGRLLFQGALGQIRNRLVVNRPAILRERGREQIEEEHLAGEGFR